MAQRPTFKVCVQLGDFDVSAELAALRAGDGRVGAACSFVGTVRDRHMQGLEPEAAGIQTLELEHYPGMTERSIHAILEDAARRFEVLGATVIHRVGLLRPLDQIVLVAVTSPHRGHSFLACEFVMDYLKTQAPFWKREQVVSSDGSIQQAWVDARVSDDVALQRWGVSAQNVTVVGAQSAQRAPGT